MEKLSFEELSTLADSTADSTLLEQISGGTSNDCHDAPSSSGSGGNVEYIILLVLIAC